MIINKLDELRCLWSSGREVSGRCFCGSAGASVIGAGANGLRDCACVASVGATLNRFCDMTRARSAHSGVSIEKKRCLPDLSAGAIFLPEPLAMALLRRDNGDVANLGDVTSVGTRDCDIIIQVRVRAPCLRTTHDCISRGRSRAGMR